MAFTVGQLADILQLFFPQAYPAQSALLALGTLAALIPLWDLHRTQHLRARQPRRTGWMDSVYKSFKVLLSRRMLPEPDYSTRLEDAGAMHALSDDFEQLLNLSELDTQGHLPILTLPSYLLCTTRSRCTVCLEDGPHAPYVLYRHEEPQRVEVVLPSFERRTAVVISAHCTHCHTFYYPDRISIRDVDNPRIRRLRLEPDPEYIRISKPGKLWAHRDLMRIQASAFQSLYAGWSSFSKFVKNSTAVATAAGIILNERQSKRLFAEHFSCRLLAAHGIIADFRCMDNATTDDLMSAVVKALGRDKGTAPGAFTHRCAECTHRKVSPSHPPNVQASAASHTAVVGAEQAPSNDQLPELPVPPSQPAPQDDNAGDANERVVNMVVIDEKVIQHWICAVSDCEKPLVNYKNGRFCADHLKQGLDKRCAIGFCNRSVASESPVCDIESHANWYRHYQNRFGRLSYQGVRRVVRGQAQSADPSAAPVQTRVHLPPIGEMPGNQVPHTLRPRSVYCIQTAQWACGYPIGWMKMYGSETLPQVYKFLCWLWPTAATRRRPSFIAYDLACKLLRHIVTTHFDDGWLDVTRFVVDAWHYINHVSGDDICRIWCNPAPMDGSQPDLVLEKTDDSGTVHKTRAFNLETAEQFNSWLDRYKGLLEQMTATSHDFVMHVLFMLYADIVTERAKESRRKEARRRRRNAAQGEASDEQEEEEEEEDEN
ncbi:hypothetical protein AURDEDRAFT_160202 [Auricularia subglabra TFB-10046 SS5]|nr:hypothetical protein AURDEDRAFT_160202 [Auricularia subglabra TFB-10046 SS5]